MEYAAMLSQPELVSGLQDLLGDNEVAVVKRTIRVFANVYRHALRLLAAGDLDHTTFTAAWPAMRGVADHILGMLATAENEGVTVHVVRFLEAAIVAHLLSDVSRYPDVAAHAPKMVAKGVASLKELISTPYIGGSAFLVGVRALITVACYKPDLWVPVTSLLERQIASPPPTLFDHNVRSLHKTLQRNLFRLLRRADSVALRSQLVEMMVTVGVPRRMLAQWAPPPEARKRPAQPHSEEAITGRASPPTKRIRGDDGDDDAAKEPPRDPRNSRDPRVTSQPSRSRDPRNPRENKDPRDPRDPRASTRGEPRSAPKDPRMAAASDAPVKPRSRPESPAALDSFTPDAGLAAAMASRSSRKEITSNFEFLKSLITQRRRVSSSFLDRCSEKERALFERLDHPSVVRLVLSCLDLLPDSPPDDLLAKLGRGPGDVAGIREQLTTLMAPHIHADFISSLAEEEEGGSAPPSRPSSNSSTFSTRATPPQSETSAPSPPSSARSTPSDPASVCHSDVDLRHLLDRGFRATGDVDMRDTRHLLPPPTSTRLDPRVAASQGGDASMGGIHPRFSQAYIDAQEPSPLSRGAPFPQTSRPPYIPPTPPPYTDRYVGAPPPFMNGNRHRFDMGGYEPPYHSPPMAGPPDVGYMAPRGMVAPWDGGACPPPRMGVMMPVINGGHGMYSPPMHL